VERIELGHDGFLDSGPVRVDVRRRALLNFCATLAR
jgi:hypothetical protein